MKAVIGLAVVLALGVAHLGRTTLMGSAARAADPPALGSGGSASSLDLKGQLEKGLKCRRPQDFAYVAGIVARVEAGILPRELVDSTFGWARHKPSDRRVQYFEFALRTRAAKEGIKL